MSNYKYEDTAAKAAYEFGAECKPHCHWDAIDCEDKIVFFGTRAYTLDIIKPWVERFDSFYQTEHGFGGVICDYRRAIDHEAMVKEFYDLYVAKVTEGAANG